MLHATALAQQAVTSRATTAPMQHQCMLGQAVQRRMVAGKQAVAPRQCVPGAQRHVRTLASRRSSLVGNASGLCCPVRSCIRAHGHAKGIRCDAYQELARKTRRAHSLPLENCSSCCALAACALLQLGARMPLTCATVQARSSTLTTGPTTAPLRGTTDTYVTWCSAPFSLVLLQPPSLDCHWAARPQQPALLMQVVSQEVGLPRVQHCCYKQPLSLLAFQGPAFWSCRPSLFKSEPLLKIVQVPGGAKLGAVPAGCGGGVNSHISL